jgi:hypothetical protein
MSVAELPASPVLAQNLEGVIRGKVIELDSDPQLPDGQLVSVVLRPISDASNVPVDVAAFARVHRVEDCLSSILKMTSEVFPGSRTITTRLDEDPEIPTDRHIVVRVQTAGLSVAQGLGADRRWHERLIQICPTRLAWIFRLGLETGS